MKYLLNLLLCLLCANVFAQSKKIDIIIQDRDYSTDLDFSGSDITSGDSINSFKVPVLTNFQGTLKFDFAIFLSDVHFSYPTFFKGVNFFGAKFSKTVWFEKSVFSKGANFVGAEFSTNVDLSASRISEILSFNFSKFNGNSILNLSHLILDDNSSLTFSNTKLPHTVLFAENHNFKPDIYFTEANFSDSIGNDNQTYPRKPILLYLYNSNIAKLHIDYVHFKLLLPDKPSKIIPNQKVLSFDEKAAIYESLLNNFKTNGQSDSYKLLDIEYQQAKWGNSAVWWLPCIPQYWWNFGYDKQYIFIWVLIFIIPFTGFTYFFLHSLNTKVYPIKQIKSNVTWTKKWSFDDFANRLWCSLMYTSTIFFMLNLKIENLAFKEKRATFYLLTVYTIGLLCLAYMANFVLQK